MKIIEILKNTEKNAILYDKLRDACVVFKCLNYKFNTIICSLNGQTLTYSKYGGFSNLFPNGEQILVPSKEMRDWEKFAWKKGDVLIYSDILVIFDKWANDDYSEFKAAFEFKWGSNYFDKGNTYYTSEFCKAIDEITSNFIKEIEEHYGGKLNLETLEIERKSQFKDGDIVCFYGGRGCYDAIAIIKEQEKKTFNVYTFIEVPIMKLYYQYNNFYPYTRKARLATEEEKQQLFAALEKENKAWDAEKKAIVDLPKKCMFKPLDKVLVRNYDSWRWRINLFSHYEKDTQFKYACLSGNFLQCIPYNEETKHLLGTTDNWEGGEA